MPWTAVDTRIGERTAGERRLLGKSLRKVAPRSSHAAWSLPADRTDPVALLEEQNESRLPWLVPIRRARMRVSPFTFYRGAARIMASDLSSTPVSGLEVQISGDAHLSNFGAYASPERRLVFDLNDFDETFPGPWEWDVKRLAVSFRIAAEHVGASEKTCRKITRRVVRTYQHDIGELADRGYLSIWYAHLPLEDLLDLVARKGAGRRLRRRGERFIEKARSKDSLQALGKLAEEVDGAYRIKSDPPVLVPLRDLPLDATREQAARMLRDAFQDYATTLPAHVAALIRRYRAKDFANKVVGVGSVGTRCWIVLLEGRDREDPLFLQFKQASRSVLEEYLAPGAHEHQGQRVVEGQHLMQTVSDVFLGWRTAVDGNDYYWRQLRDGKGSLDVENADAEELDRYARLCGWTLARSHARSGDPIAIAGYLGRGDAFPEAVTEFAERYARQNLEDYFAFTAAIERGELEAVTEEA